LLQWDNLIPLIDNALVQEYTDGKTGSLLLVGDAKQSIYRWRGGLPEQFIDIYNCKNPFPAVEKKVENLATNFRSATQIINFNNSFFSYVANYFDDPVHSELYKLGNHQLPTDKQGGYVRIDFVQAENKEELSEVYSEKVINTILELKQQGFNYSDICILTRTKDDGIALGRAMMDQNIAVVSSETLLLQHSPLVSFLLNCLELRPMPDNEEAKAHMLFFLHQHLEIAEASSDFLSGFFPSTTSEFEIRLQQYAINFSLQKLNSLSLYEACEYCIIAFKLAPKADAYLDGFLNLIHEFQQQYSIAMNSFFDYWETKKDIAAISTADNMDAIRLMTIHKAKGLEFPVVLLPYADVRIYREKQAKAWYPGGEITDQFDSFLINYNKEVASYGTIGANLHEERRHKLQLDNMNLLYVALTRAVEQLYIFSQYVSADDADVPQSYNQFFIGFLRSEGLWETSKLRYEFGKNIMVHEHSRLNTVTEIIPEYYCSFPQDHNLYITSGEASLWHSEAERAIETGTVLHELMSKIITKDDLPAILADFRTTNAYSELHLTELQQMISNIVMHPDMLELFSGIDHIENERDIITAEGMLLRPDRLNLHADGTVTITDYKTGEPQATHTDQIKCYGSALEAMGYGIRELLIIYASGEGILINKL
jgi:ATP-dependent exoDNAse (exonuclease V) beta subunit